MTLPYRRRKSATVPELRVVVGRRRGTPGLRPWMLFSLIAVTAFLGLIMARTALDADGMRLARLEKEIVAEQNRSQQLLLEVGELESPSRIGPAAKAMGMVYPDQQLMLSVPSFDAPAGVSAFAQAQVAP